MCNCMPSTIILQRHLKSKMIHKTQRMQFLQLDIIVKPVDYGHLGISHKCPDYGFDYPSLFIYD